MLLHISAILERERDDQRYLPVIYSFPCSQQIFGKISVILWQQFNKNENWTQETPFIHYWFHYLSINEKVCSPNSEGSQAESRM